MLVKFTGIDYHEHLEEGDDLGSTKTRDVYINPMSVVAVSQRHVKFHKEGDNVTIVETLNGIDRVIWGDVAEVAKALNQQSMPN